MRLTGLGWEEFTPEGVEFFGKINFMKAGLVAADLITTVSKTYSREIQTAENGHGLEGVLAKRAKDLFGSRERHRLPVMGPGARPGPPPDLQRDPPCRQDRAAGRS